MKRRVAALLLALAAVAAASAADPVQVYRSPADFARSGDYEFRYPTDLLVLQDYVYDDARVDGALHTVVLRHKDAQSGDLRSIEINMLRSLKRRMTCDDYSACRVVGGIVIGTNSEDPELLRALDEVAGSFKRRPKA